jgi:asparagine synthase (glutamine-hydrolysing)
MCGIAGIFRRNTITNNDIDIVNTMNNIQKHRGPDDEGLFYDDNCVLGHRRLAIIDLSKDGHQPFISDDGRFHLVYNGEIYNYLELRIELESLGCHFKTKTDTEVLLKSYQQYGENCLHKFNGMFAFVIYDSIKHTLFLARDRVGVKPLYYANYNGSLFFASEIKALHAIPGLRLSLNYKSLFDYLVFNRTDVFDETFFNEINRIPNGFHAFFNEDGLKLSQWWNPEDYLCNTAEYNETEAKDRIHDILVSAVKLRMRSDVPVGSCLSGGLDSSILLGVLFGHDLARRKYPTFTASFPGHKIDETSYIDILNKKYPFNNFRTYPSARTAADKLREFVYTNDEPTTNHSFFSQYEVMRLAKDNGVTVLLDGQGGDEIFAGYHYLHGFNMYGLLKEKKMIRLCSELYKNFSRQQDKSAYQTFIFQILPGPLKKQILLKTLPHLRHDFFYDFIEGSRIYNKFFDAENLNQSLVRHLQYKLEHLLRMEDRNSMHFSLEARVPYLDYRLIEYALGIPGDVKIKNGETKYLQKLSMGKYTVQEILSRTDKIGFGTPGDEWMLTDEWQELTKQNFTELSGSLSDVFKRDVHLSEVGMDRWKINQLAVWKDIFLN